MRRRQSALYLSLRLTAILISGVLTISFMDVLELSVQFSQTLCDPMDCSTSGFLVHHQLSEFIQTHVHWVSDAIQPSHSLSSPSLPAFNLYQYQGFSNESALCIRWPKHWSFSFSISPSNEHSGLILRMDWFDHPKDSQEFSLTPLFESTNSLTLSLLYGPTFTSIHDHWKNYSVSYMDWYNCFFLFPQYFAYTSNSNTPIMWPS